MYSTGSNGKIIKTKVDKRDIFKAIIDKGQNLNMVKFAFPGVTPGCVIEYRYEHIENGSYDISPWLFQDKIPVALSYCEINYPSFSILDYHLAGQLSVNKIDYREWPIDSSRMPFKKVFLMTNIPSFKIEPFMSSLVDNLKKG